MATLARLNQARSRKATRMAANGTRASASCRIAIAAANPKAINMSGRDPPSWYHHTTPRRAIDATR